MSAAGEGLTEPLLSFCQRQKYSRISLLRSSFQSPSHKLLVSMHWGETMKERTILWQAAGFAAVTFGGTILHFLYDWSGRCILIAPFSGVNESTWEHMKLLYWPLFLFALAQHPFFAAQKNYWCVKLAEILLGLVLIPVLFYTCNGVFGTSPDWGNISIFYVTAALAFLFEWLAFQNDWLPWAYPKLAFIAICIIGVLFVVFTFAPPQIPLFQDPLA